MKAIKVDQDRWEGFKGFLGALLEKGVVGAVLVPFKVPTGESFAHLLTSDPARLEEAWPVAPVMSIQGGRVVSRLTRKGPVEMATAVVLRPCELAAMRELVKLNQVKPQGLLTISFDCPGTYSLKNYLEGNREEMEAAFKKALGDFQLAGAKPLCQVCTRFTGKWADIEVGFLGAPQGSFYLVAHTPQGEQVLEALGYTDGADLSSREQAIEEMTQGRMEKREAYFKEEFGPQVASPQALLDTLHNCINCHNCMRVCPICFCRECFFESDALKVAPHNYLMRAGRKGALRFMPDTLLFHTGRMNHMSLSCVSCGACEDACPNAVPVSRLFAMVGDRTRAIFNYEPGRDLEEPIPFLDYREEELQEWEVPYTQSTTHCPSSS